MSSRRVADALAAPMARHIGSMRVGAVGVSVSFEGEFHSCAKVGVLGNQGH